MIDTTVRQFVQSFFVHAHNVMTLRLDPLLSSQQWFKLCDVFIKFRFFFVFVSGLFLS